MLQFILMGVFIWWPFILLPFIKEHTILKIFILILYPLLILTISDLQDSLND